MLPRIPNRERSPRYGAEERTSQTDEYPETESDVGRTVPDTLRSRLHERQRRLPTDNGSSTEPDERAPEWQTKAHEYGPKAGHVSSNHSTSGTNNNN